MQCCKGYSLGPKIYDINRINFYLINRKRGCGNKIRREKLAALKNIFCEKVALVRK